MVQKLENKKGFTLVEALVTAVIILVLAAVTVPIYLGYVNDARQDAVDNLAETAAAAANNFARKHGGDADLTGPEVLNLYYDDTKHKITIETGANTVEVTDLKNISITKTLSYQ